MKNKIIKYLSIMVILFTCFFYCIKQNEIKADSGWDSSYDSGGSWDSGSSWDSDSSWDSGSSWDWDSSSGSYHSSGSSGGISFIIFVVIVVVFILIVNKGNNHKTYTSSTVNTSLNFDSVSEEEIKKIIPDFNKQRFLNDAYQTYLNIQKAWSNFDTKALRNMLSDELYNTYNSQLKVLKAKKQKNVMSDFVMDSIDINSINLEGEKVTLTCILRVNFYDYVVDSEEKVVRGTNTKKVDITYELTFVSTVTHKEVKNCPSCGAPVKGKAADKCEYCGSTLVKNTYDWVLAKKENKHQQFK